jgi:hypothetical protein
MLGRQNRLFLAITRVRGLSSSATLQKKKLLPNAQALWPAEGGKATAILSPSHPSGNLRVGGLEIPVEPAHAPRATGASGSAGATTGAQGFESGATSTASEKARFLNISALREQNILGATDVDTPRPIDFTDMDASLLQASAQVAQMLPSNQGSQAATRVARYGATQTSTIGDSAMGSVGPTTTEQTTTGAWAASASEGVEGPVSDPAALKEKIDATERQGMEALRDSGGNAREAIKKQEDQRRGAAYSGPMSQQPGSRRGGRTFHSLSFGVMIKTGAGVAEPSLYGPPPASDSKAKQYPSKTTSDWAKVASSPRTNEAVNFNNQSGSTSVGTDKIGQGLGFASNQSTFKGTDEYSPTGNPSIYSMPNGQAGAAKAAVYSSLGTTYSGTSAEVQDKQMNLDSLREREDTGVDLEKEEMSKSKSDSGLGQSGEHLRSHGMEQARGKGGLGEHPGRR